MPWWAWLAMAAALLAAEVAIQTEFWLAILGASALLVGLCLLGGAPLPLWAQWLGFALLSIVLAVTVRRQIHTKLVAPAEGLEPELVGEHGASQASIAPGGTGSVEVRGSVWRAHNVGARALEPGDAIQVESLDGLTLRVKPLS